MPETPLRRAAVTLYTLAMQLGQLIAGRFVLQELAGSGGMGHVFRAHDRDANRSVALKVMRADGYQPEQVALFGDRFAREARVLADLRHPSIVEYVAHGATPEGELFLAMEWLEGEDLGHRLPGERLSIGDALGIATQVADALEAVHARGVVHRDIKPTNIFLAGPDRRVKLLDFGIAKLHAPSTAFRTASGLSIGTPGYMAPEQARGEVLLDARADVFSLGCVLWECVTGRATFVAEHVVAILGKILFEEAPLASELRSDVPRRLDELIARMLSKKREERPTDGGALARELRAVGPLDDVAAHANVLLGRREQRLVSIVLASEAEVDAEAKTELVGTPDTMRASVVSFDRSKHPANARVERLSNGSLFVLLSAKGSATDLAARAARIALAMHASLPRASLALATGRALLGEHAAIGEVIDRGASLLRTSEKARQSGDASAIRIDEVTAGLLDEGFQVASDPLGLVLFGERSLLDRTRKLLGKATACVGRERELSTLGAIVDESVSESVARAVVVTAPAGVGKSRIALELLHRVGDRAQVMIGRGDPMSAGAPYGLLGQAIRSSAGIVDGEPSAVRQQKLQARLARTVADDDLSRVTAFIGELAAVPFGDELSPQLGVARRDARLMGDQMRRAWGDLVAAECRKAPLLLVLEDLHWGDVPSVAAIDLVLREHRDQPLMVLALARPEVHDIFPKLWADRDVTELRLTGLSPKAAEKLARSALGPDVSAELVRTLVVHADGNAFYLEELVRAAAAGKTGALPATVIAMVQRRLEELPDDARQVLRAASIFGGTFSRDGVARLAAGVVEAAVDELVERELVTRAGVARRELEVDDARYEFRHALVREAAYAMLTDADKSLGHRLAATWLEEIGERDAIVLAEHYERGDDVSRAIEWWQRGAADALVANDFVATIARAERGVACGAEGEALGALRLSQADAERWGGSVPNARRWAIEARRHFSGYGVEWCRTLGCLADLARSSTQPEELEEIAEALGVEEAPFVSEAATVERWSSLAISLRWLWPVGRYEPARRLAPRLFAAADAIGPRDPLLAARVADVKSMQALFDGDLGAHLRSLSGLVSAYELAGDLREATRARGYLGDFYKELGQYERSETLLRAAQAAVEKLGIAHSANVGNLVHSLGRLGALEEARTLIEAALASSREASVLYLEGVQALFAADIHALMGDLDRAFARASLALERLRDIPGLCAAAYARLAQIELAREKNTEALVAARAAAERLDALGGMEEGEALVRLSLAEALHATGDHAAARDAIRKARDALLTRAATLDEPELRASFLGRVTENVRTLELAEEWLATA